jgi:hypothetical protein
VNEERSQGGSQSLLIAMMGTCVALRAE